MVDVVDSATRSQMMAGIRGRNTKPEILVRRLLHKLGFRFRLHVRDLPGKPDIVLPRYRAVISFTDISGMATIALCSSGRQLGQTSGAEKSPATKAMMQGPASPCSMAGGEWALSGNAR